MTRQITVDCECDRCGVNLICPLCEPPSVNMNFILDEIFSLLENNKYIGKVVEELSPFDRDVLRGDIRNILENCNDMEEARDNRDRMLLAKIKA